MAINLDSYSGRLAHDLQGGFTMRRMFYAVLLFAALSTSVGCIIPAFSGDRARRTQQLIFTSENQRQILNFWERFWHMDQPDHMAPQRVHGGVI